MHRCKCDDDEEGSDSGSTTCDGSVPRIRAEDFLGNHEQQDLRLFLQKLIGVLDWEHLSGDMLSLNFADDCTGSGAAFFTMNAILASLKEQSIVKDGHMQRV